MNDHDTLIMLAKAVKARCTVFDLANWYRFNYTGGEMVRHPCPSCHTASKSKKTVQLSEGGKHWYCHACGVSGDVIDWLAALYDCSKGAAIGRLADRVGVSSDPDSIIRYLQGELSQQTRAMLSHDAGTSTRVRETRQAYWKWRREFANRHQTAMNTTAINFFVSGGNAHVGTWQTMNGLWWTLQTVASRGVDVSPVVAAIGAEPHKIREQCYTTLAEHYKARRLVHNAVEVYARNIVDSHNPAAHAYMSQRHIDIETVTDFYLGFSTGRDFPRPTTEVLTQLCSVGLRRMNYTDPFSRRLTFPICDLDPYAPCAGIAGRIVDAGTDAPKYINTSESAGFSKRHTLFNIAKALRHATESNTMVLVESYMDVIACHNNGVRNVVACMGTAVTPEHADLLSRLVGRVVLMLNPDEAGERAAKNAYAVLQRPELVVGVAHLPDGLDCDELARAGKGKSLKRLVARAVADSDTPKTTNTPTLLDIQRGLLASDNL